MSKYTIAIDLGEKSVIAIAGTNDSRGQLQIAAVATRQTRGLKAGRIENIAQVNEALSGVIAELETRLNVKIQQSYGGISGEYIRCERHSEKVVVSEPNSGVGAADVGALHALMRNVEAPEVDTIMEYTPQNYIVDTNEESRSPVGTFGRTLSSTFNFVLCEKEALKRLNLAFKQSGITLKRCFANAIASAEAVLSSDEMEAGVAVVDMGEGMTNIAIYQKGVLRYLASIPIGGSAINADIRSLMIHESSIESIKCDHGTAVAELAPKESIDVVGRTARDNRAVPLYNIAVAIQERVTDIIIFVHREIRDSGYMGRLPYGLVLTGGGAKLKDIDESFRRNLDVEVRIANPEEGIGAESLQQVASPEFATVVGVLKRGVEMDAKGVGKSCIAEEEPIVEVPPVQEPETEEVVSDGGEVKPEEPQKEEPIAEKSDVEQKEEKKSEESRGAKYGSRETKVDDAEPKSNPLMRFMKSLADKVNNMLTSPDDDQEF